MKNSPAHRGYLSCFLNSIKNIYFSHRCLTSDQGAHAKVDEESERNIEYNQSVEENLQ